jgi:hypothetical protein
MVYAAQEYRLILSGLSRRTHQSRMRRHLPAFAYSPPAANGNTIPSQTW